MKNKGRFHKASRNENMPGIMNCKGKLVHITRPIESMSPNGHLKDFSRHRKFLKKKWHKRVRGYFKTAKFLSELSKT